MRALANSAAVLARGVDPFTVVVGGAFAITVIGLTLYFGLGYLYAEVKDNGNFFPVLGALILLTAIVFVASGGDFDF